MRTTKWNANLLRGVSPTQISSYLTSTGWLHSGRDGTLGEIWTYGGDAEDAHIVVPVEIDFLDYPRRLLEALEVIGELERRDVREVIKDAQNSFVDTLRFARRGAGVGSFSIALDEGATLFEHARAMVVAAACTAVSPRAVVPSRKPFQAMDYISKARFGHTEEGSFVVRVLTPATPLLTPRAQGLIEVLEEPFPRKVIRTLCSALASTSTAVIDAGRSGQVEHFEATVEHGVSANLLEALSGSLGGPTPEKELFIDVKWATGVVPSGIDNSEYLFNGGNSEILLRAAQYLREKSPIEDQAITGVVVNLHRDEKVEDGTITVSCVIDEVGRSLRVTLGPAEYLAAIDAHRNKKAVFFRADILRDGRLWIARNVSAFRVIEN